MTLEVVEGGRGFYRRCPVCGFEHPKSPVNRRHLGFPPIHNCPEAGEEDRPDLKMILEEQEQREHR
jgi:hypothetical protein